MPHSKVEGLSFLLRLWQVEDNGGVLWRASLEDALGNQWGFADLVALSTFLQNQTASAPDRDELEEGSRLDLRLPSEL